MKIRRVVFATLIAAITLCGLRSVAALLVMKDIAAPHTTRIQVIRSVVSPKYQVVAPHRGFFSEIRNAPSASRERLRITAILQRAHISIPM